MRRIIVIPAVFIGCLVVMWVGTVAAANMPSQELLAPTLTAGVEQVNAGSPAASDSGMTQHGINQDSQASGCSLSTGYPHEVRQWCDLIEASSTKTGLPANLIAAVILQESGGNPKIYSSSGAVGLMQVMPRDGLAAEFMCINGPCFAARPTIDELKDPAFNVQFGTQMLADLYAKHGSYREALYRYGPMDIGYYYADLVLKIYNTY
jgi:soluble lytic murein transglycosylase-like protein